MLKKLFYAILTVGCIAIFGACGQAEQPQISIVEMEPDPGPDVTGVASAPLTGTENMSVVENGNMSGTESANTPNSETTENPPATPQEAFGINEENSSDVTGVWEGYTVMDFKSFFTKGITNMLTNVAGTAPEKCEMSVVKGWNCEGFLDEGTVGQGNQPVTYVVFMTQKYEEKTVELGYKFYMELIPGNILKVKGAESFVGGAEYGTVYEEADANAMLEELKTVI